MSEIHLRIKPEDICDFCSEPHPTRTFHLDDFKMMDKSPGFPEFRSKGNWLACTICGNFIDAEDWNKLAEHATKRLWETKYKGVMPYSFLAGTVKKSHDLFRQHYKKSSSEAD